MEDIALGEPRVLMREEGSAACELRFTELVQRQSRFLFRVAYALLRNVDDAEDVVQETFLKLYRTGAWERMQDERAFLARVAWRIATARRSTKPTYELDPAMPEKDSRSPEERVIVADWNATVSRLIDSLPEALRRPLALSAVEGLTSREIGEIIGVGEGTVRTRILRAREILTEKLAALSGGSHGR